MPTVTPLLRTSYKSKDDTYPIVIRVIDGKKQKLFAVGYKIEKQFWKNNQVSGKHPKSILINAAISNKEAEISRYLADCQLHGKPIHLDLIGTGRASHSFTDYLRHRGKQYDAAGKIIMSRKVARFVVELLESAGREVYFEDVNLDFLRKLEQTMIDNDNVENTRHKKFKFLSEFYTHAMAEGKAPAPNPFKQYKIVAKPVKKDKLTDQEIKTIEDLELAPGPVNDARNLFLFSYYAKGARFENCIMIKRSDIHSGRIFFRTNKGNKYISVKIHERLQAILNHYPEGEYIFPYTAEAPAGAAAYLKHIDSRNVIVNRNLKVVQALAEIKTHLTFHIARHSFAYHLKKVSDNINVIQDSLGHSDQRTTQIYLKALDDDRLDGEMEKLYGV
jgi:integrase/recombinase XerD